MKLFFSYTVYYKFNIKNHYKKNLYKITKNLAKKG